MKSTSGSADIFNLTFGFLAYLSNFWPKLHQVACRNSENRKCYWFFFGLTVTRTGVSNIWEDPDLRVIFLDSVVMRAFKRYQKHRMDNKVEVYHSMSQGWKLRRRRKIRTTFGTKRGAEQDIPPPYTSNSSSNYL